MTPIFRTLLSGRCRSSEHRLAPALQIGLGIELAEDLDHGCDDPGPAGLMTGADTGAVVAVKVFVEQQVVAPARVCLEFLGAAIDRAAAGMVAEEDMGQPI